MQVKWKRSRFISETIQDTVNGRRIGTRVRAIIWSVAYLEAVVKVRGNAGERRSWAPKKCQLAFLGPTQPKFQGERKGERSSWAPNNAGQRSPTLHNLWPVGNAR